MAFRLVNPIDVSQISLYPKVERQDPTIDSKGWDQVGDYLLRDKIDFMPMKGLQEAVCSCESNLIFMCGAMSMGKAQPLYSKVLTPKGYKQMGDMAVGDEVIGRYGEVNKVCGIYPQGKRPIYKVTLNDNSSCHCDIEHLWLVNDNEVISLQEIINRGYSNNKFTIPKYRSNAVVYIEDVEFVGYEVSQCIMVDSPDHLYVTDNFIVTHNTYCMDLIPLYGIDKPSYSGAMISVRALDSKKGSSIFRDALEVVGKFADCEVTSAETPTFFWRQWNSSFRLIHSNFNADNPTEWDEFKDYAKKVQASYIAIDEATQIKQFKMFIYWFGRNRDSSGMTPQMILSFNPEHTHFTTEMLRDAGYLDENWYLRPEMNGVTRYFYVAGDTPESIIWGDSYEAVAERANIHLTEKEINAGITIKQIIKTFTCFTGEAADNLKLVAATKGQALGNLHALGGTQRSINKGAYFGPIEKEDNNVSRSMIHNLWENPIDDDENMYATFDVGGGKGDSAPLIVWKGLQMVSIDYFKGEPQELSNWIQTILNRYNVPITNFAYDGTGFGYWLQGLTNGLAITANKRPLKEYDEYGNEVMRDEYFNLRSQLLGKLEVALKRGDISCSIDKNKPVQFGVKNETRRFVDVLLDGIDLFATTIKNNKTYYKSKEEFKAKYKYSPGEIDSMMLRMAFELDTRERKQPKAQVSEDAYDELFNPHPLNNWGNRYWRN